MATILCPLFEVSCVNGEQVAVLDQHRSFHYWDFEGQVRACTNKLAGLGVKKEDRVALCNSNSFEYMVLLLALWRLKAVACPLSTRLPAQALGEQLDVISASRLILGQEVEAPAAQAPITWMDELMGNLAANHQNIPPPYYELDQPATILFTSGSSGKSKPALHTMGAHYYNALGANINMHLTAGDRWLVTLPFYHVGGLGIIFRCLMGGATMALPKPGEALADEMQLFTATHVSVVPTQLQWMMEDPELEAATDHLKCVLVGGAPVSLVLLEQAHDAGLPVHATYGLTEMASQVATAPRFIPVNEKTASGKVLKYRELKTAPDGEILVRGQTLFSGYWSAETLDPALDDEGWFHTGDLGILDAAGFVTLLGRKDFMFISGGENIQPEEIEQVLIQAFHFDQAVVVPVPDPEFGQRPAAFVQGHPDALDGEALKIKLEEYLPRFKIPVVFFPWPEDEKDSIKVNRKHFAERALKLRS